MLYFTGILRVRRVGKMLDVFEVFPWFFKETKEKKDGAGTDFWEGDAMKQKSVKRNAFSLNEGKAFSE